MDNNKAVEIVKTKSNEFGFLFKKISLTRSRICNLLLIDEFLSALREAKANNVTIDNMWFYKKAKEFGFPLMKEISGNVNYKQDYALSHSEDEYKQRNRRILAYMGIMNGLSERLFGEKDQWLFDYNSFYGEPFENPVKTPQVFELPDGCSDISYVLDICIDSGLKKRTIKFLFTSDEMLDSIRNAEKIETISDVYSVFQSVFFPLVRCGYKRHEDEGKRRAYYIMRDVALDFSRTLTGNENSWRRDFRNSCKQ